jgi:iron(II)-dependent oxidoreductase
MQTFNGVQMVLVPAGCFMMGSTDGEDDEKPVHEVCFEESFWIDRFEVTNGQYGSSGQFIGQHHPRESVMWSEAYTFCVSRNGRLPTEAEWEYAARGPEGWSYPWGNEFVANNVIYNTYVVQRTSVVGEDKRPNGASWVGAYDMSGNVSEWVSDWYAPYTENSLTDPNGPGSGQYRIRRGGSWYDRDVRAAIRDKTIPDVSSIFVGFRCARDN